MSATINPHAEDRLAETSAVIHDLLAQRWSPRTYDPSGEISDTELTSLLEAARWAPSASNRQPRRFLVHRRGTEGFERVVSHLAPGNQRWAANSAVLVVGIAELTGTDGAPRRWAHYDLGQSLAHLTVQAQALGLSVRQMGGVDGPALAADFGVPDRFEVLSVTAVGRFAEPADGAAPPPRVRRPLAELVNPASWD